MKTIYLALLMFASSLGYSQIIIGDNVGTATDKTSVLLEFAMGQNKGIILPYVRTLPTTNLVAGTIVLDATDPTQAKVKMYDGTAWVDLSSGVGANITTYLASQPSTTTADPNAKVIIGSNTTSADGVLVLESSTKAMVLPMVGDTASIPEPAPGMMVYVNKPGFKRLAVYNGAVWTYWKP